MSEGRRKHSREFKIEAVGLPENGKSGKELEEALGIASGMGLPVAEAVGDGRRPCVPRQWESARRGAGPIAQGSAGAA